MKQPSQRYSQRRALWAITRASFKAIFANPSAIIFSILFPIIFIMIFGSFGNGGGSVYRVTIAPGSDTTNEFYDRLKNSGEIRIVHYADTMLQRKDLIKGKLTGVLSIRKAEGADSTGQPYLISLRTTSAAGMAIGGAHRVLEYITLKMESSQLKASDHKFVLVPTPPEQLERRYRQIDFILPGQLGFSILFSTLFGIAFTFFSLREQLVLKRFYASPVNRINILLGIGMSRLFFQLMNIIVLVLVGHFFFNFTLHHGLLTFAEILIMTIIMLFLLMGVGLIFSSIVKSDTSIPLLINLFGFPQMMLSGTFFPIEVFPKWLQEICRVLPLTQFNDSIRKISFEGLSILDCWREIGILAIWMTIIYIVAARVIKWE